MNSWHVSILTNMYIPRKFKQENIEKLVSFIQTHSFATLVVNTSSGLEAMHLPVLLEQKDDTLYLEGHIARANPLWRKVEQGSNVLTVFHGPNCYISPSFYPTKGETGKAVPTWNYVVAHVTGMISFIHDKEWIYGVIDRITKAHETGRTEPWAINDAPEGYIEKMLPAIVGVQIEISSMEGQWKLSQNQPEVNQDGVKQQLLASGDAAAVAMAKLMQGK